MLLPGAVALAFNTATQYPVSKPLVLIERNSPMRAPVSFACTRCQLLTHSELLELNWDLKNYRGGHTPAEFANF